MSEEVRVTSSSGGQKGKKLARFDLIPVSALTHLAEHYGKGAEKYEDRNWERGYEWSLSYAALQRHLTAWWNGEDVDEETGHSHIDAVMFHAFALRTFLETHPEFDDRPKSVREQNARIIEATRPSLNEAGMCPGFPPQAFNELDYVCAENGDVTVPDIEGRDLGPQEPYWCIACMRREGVDHSRFCDYSGVVTRGERG